MSISLYYAHIAEKHKENLLILMNNFHIQRNYNCISGKTEQNLLVFLFASAIVLITIGFTIPFVPQSFTCVITRICIPTSNEVTVLSAR